MENYASNLQEKIQKLIDQYTTLKKKLEETQEENDLLTEQNLQLIEQVETQTQQSQSSSVRVSELEESITTLQIENEELINKLNGFESATTEALSKLDLVFPDLDEI